MQATLPTGLPLREDLRLHEAAPDRDGAPCWVIQDPVSNRFYRIGWFEYECLLRWQREPAQMANDISCNTPLQADENQVHEFARFLERNRLVRPSPEGLSQLKSQTNAKTWQRWQWWLHHYLFFRMPLIRPDRILARALPWFEPLFTKTALVLLLLATALGIILVARQWDVFTHSVIDLITPAGIGGFALALIVSKALHELGHALMATRLGLRVAHMGVAFVVLWPMLYTDTGESWRLRSHRQRLAISIAGVSVELALAGLATLAWALLDDGLLRQSMLYLATTAWILSLALNISPFMRFDGYFVLSDVLNFPNLHERAGEMARTWLRRTVLGLPDTYPESFSASARSGLIVFALITWAYRLIVFLGIAWAVYALFFKVLGIFLLVVEIFWFVLRPVLRELKVWIERWPQVKRSRKFKLSLFMGGLVFVLAFPWKTDVRAPGVAQPVRQNNIFASRAAQIQTLAPEGPVERGQTLAVLRVPELEDRRQRIQAAINALDHRLTGLIADEAGMGQRSALLREREKQWRELAAIEGELANLRIHAPFDGEWIDVDQTLGKGTWVSTRAPLGIVISPDEWVVDAYVGQRDIARLKKGASASFYFSGESTGVPAQVVFFDTTRSQRLMHPMLDGNLGGPIPTQTGSKQEGVPIDALYRVRLQLDAPLLQKKEVQGRVAIEGTRQSLLWNGLQRGLSVLVRESGF